MLKTLEYSKEQHKQKILLSQDAYILVETANTNLNMWNVHLVGGKKWRKMQRHAMKNVKEQ